MSKRLQWNSEALPYDFTLDQVLYDIRRTDDGENLLLDAATAKDILDDSEGIFAFDALVTPYAKLQRKMEVLQGVMERSAQEIKPLDMQITEPFKQRGVANVAVVYELSDGQTVTVYFHNPDVDPGKMAGTDEVISWKWLLNKKDITIVVAPERGNDLNVREVARRIMKLAEKNSAAFVKANIKKNETMARINGIKEEVSALEQEFKGLQHDLEVKQQEVADSAEPTHYSNLILNNLVETFGWKRTGAGSVEKNVGGGAVGGELNPAGNRLVVAAFDEPARRYLTLQSGFDNVLDLDCRILQPKEAAEKFDAMVCDWAVSTAVKVAPTPDEAVQSDIPHKVVKEIRAEAYAHGMEAFTDGSTRVAPSGMSVEQMKDWYAGWDAANIAAPIQPVAIVANEEQQPKSFDAYLDEAGGDTFEAAKAFFKSELQGKIVKTVIGDVHMTGSGFKEMKRGMKSDAAKAKLVPHVTEILTSGRYDGSTTPHKQRTDGFTAFHFFEKDVEVGDSIITAGVNVGEREGKQYEFNLSAYGLGYEGLPNWNKNKDPLSLPGNEPGADGPSKSGVATTLDATLANNGSGVNDGLNIVILKVIDKKTGKRLFEFEDDVGQEGHEQDLAKETPAPIQEQEDLTNVPGIARAIQKVGDESHEEDAENRPTIELTGKELGDFPETEDGKKALRNAAKGRLEAMVGTWVSCPTLGGDVEIRKSGVKKFISTSADARKLRLVAVLDRIIGSGRKLASRPPYDGDLDKSARAYHVIRSEVSLAGEHIAVRTVVKEDLQGKFHYDMTVHDFDAVFDSAKDEGRDESQPSNMTATNGGGTYPSRFARHQLDSIVGYDGQEFNPALDSASGYAKNNNYDVEQHNRQCLSVAKAYKQFISSGSDDDLDEYNSVVKASYLLGKKAIAKIEKVVRVSDGKFRPVDVYQFDSVALDSASGMVLNLFIEGEEPEVIEEDGEDEATQATKPAPLPTPEVIMPVENNTPVEDPQKVADKALFQSLIDKTVVTADGEGILSASLFDPMEAAYNRWIGNAEMEALFEKAVDAYQEAGLAASANL